MRRSACLALLPLAAACASATRSTASGPPERWGFTAPWDPRSAASVRAHAAELDAVVLGWIPLDSITGAPLSPYPDSLAAALPTPTRRLALVTGYGGGRFHPELLRRLAADPAALTQVSSAVADRVARDGYRGVVLDFEEMRRDDSASTRAVVTSIAAAAHARGVGPVVVALPASDTTAYPARLFAESADLLMIMLYDEHWSTSAPGPIASPDWVRRVLGNRVAEAGAERLVAALPLYGYQWRTGAPAAAAIGFADAKALAASGAVALVRDSASSTLRATSAGSDGWEVWVSDAVLDRRLEGIARELGVRRVAYWRLGLEDPALWSGVRP
jgi:spore germination protein YaaH